MQGQARSVLRRIVPWLQKGPAKTNYKGVRGRIGIVGGARDYAGAPYFAAMSTMRLGADLAYVVCSREASQVIKNYSPDLIVTPLLDCPSETEFDTEMDCLMTRLHALVVGPGLGREELLQRRAKKLIEKAKASSIPLILDADSLMMVNEDPALAKSYPKVLLTPNRIELQRMLNKIYAPETYDLRSMRTEEIQNLVDRCSRDMNVTILAKGSVDIISDGATGLRLLTDKNSGTDRRCGGQGDITCGLAGVYAHWIEQANRSTNDKLASPIAWAGYLAALTTRHCNELAVGEFGQGAVASNMVDMVHLALRNLLDNRGVQPGGVKGSSFRYAGLLTKDEIGRYARQMIMEEFGPSRQLRLKKASALIIGAGGLGCPAAVYLGAGGLGTLGIVDDDRVEASNLHRQILHNMDKVGMLKTESIKQAVLAINPNVKINTHNVKVNRYNAVELIEQYDIILDCTDNLLTRYMISDACVVAKKPLVSGAALKMDGQLTVYNYDESTPCFRCLFPEPPPPNAVGSCSENGVLGVLPGVIGVNQAVEAIKIGAGISPAYAGKMLLYDGQLGLYRQVTIGKRRTDCSACGSGSKLERHLIDYEEFCGQTCSAPPAASNVLDTSERVTVEEYSEIIKSGKPHVLVDVRPSAQSDISRLDHALQLPVMFMMNNKEETIKTIEKELKRKEASEIYVVCRKGIASQRGTRIIQDYLKAEMPSVKVKDIIGGMTTWEKRIDPDNYSCL